MGFRYELRLANDGDAGSFEALNNRLGRHPEHR